MRTPTQTQDRLGRQQRRQRLLICLLGGSAIVGSACWPMSLVAAPPRRPALILKRSTSALLTTSSANSSPAVNVSTNPHVHSSPPQSTERPKAELMAGAGASAKMNPFVIRPTVRASVIQQAADQQAVDIDDIQVAKPIETDNDGLARTGPSPLPTLATPRLMAPIAPSAKLIIANPVVAPVRENPLASPEATIEGWEVVEPLQATDIGQRLQGSANYAAAEFSSTPTMTVSEPIAASEPIASEPEFAPAEADADELSFSLSDDMGWDSTLADQPGGVQPQADGLTNELNGDSSAEGYTYHLDVNSLDAREGHQDASDLTHPAPMARGVAPSMGQPVQPIVIAAVQPTPIKNSQADPDRVVDFDKLLRQYRFRPPVDVDSIPTPAVSHTAEPATAIQVADSFTEALTQQDEAFDLDITLREAEPIAPPSPAETVKRQKLELPKGTKLVPLKMNLASVRSLTLGGQLRDVHVMDDSVCQAVATANNQVKLIGTGNGTTQLVLWAEKTDADGRSHRLLRAFEVCVDDHKQAATADDSLDALDESIRQTFPTADIQLSHFGNQLRVSGRCDTELQAKKILRMVRRTCLMPVDDDLKVQ